MHMHDTCSSKDINQEVKWISLRMQRSLRKLVKTRIQFFNLSVLFKSQVETTVFVYIILILTAWMILYLMLSVLFYVSWSI